MTNKLEEAVARAMAIDVTKCPFEDHSQAGQDNLMELASAAIAAIEAEGMAIVDKAVLDELLVTGWRPIDTAPMDGRYVLLAVQGMHIPVIGRSKGSRFWHCYPEVKPMSEIWHWMPLPEPPRD